MTTAYCIKGPDGTLYVNQVRESRERAIPAFQNEYGGNSWREREAEGFKCVPVKLVEVPDADQA